MNTTADPTLIARRFGLVLRLFFGSLPYLGIKQWLLLWFTPASIIRFGQATMQLNPNSHIRKLADFCMIWEVFHDDAYPYVADKKNPVIVDIGAHIGSFGVSKAIRYPGARIYCYEPFPPTCTLLRANTAAYPNITVYNSGVSDSRKTATLYINSINPAQNSAFKKTSNSVDIHLVSLQDVFTENGIDRIDLLKIDCEGSEFDILFSAASLLDKVDVLYLEVHDPVYFGIRTTRSITDLESLLKQHFTTVNTTRIDNYTCYMRALRK